VCVEGACGDEPREVRCGDAVVSPPLEECDSGSSNRETGPCTPSCRHNVCGDTMVAAGVESCDDGNDVPNDGCDECVLPGEPKWQVQPGTDGVFGVDATPDEALLALRASDEAIVPCTAGTCSGMAWPSARPEPSSQLLVPLIRASLDGGAFVGGSYDPDPYDNRFTAQLTRYSNAGSILWTTVLSTPETGWNLWLQHIERAGGLVAVAGRDDDAAQMVSRGYAAVLNLDGTVRWSTGVPREYAVWFDWIALAEDGSACVSGQRRAAFMVGCFDQTGNRTWSADLESIALSLSFEAAPGSLEVLTRTGRRSFDVATGAELMPTPVDWGIYSISDVRRFGSRIVVGGSEESDSAQSGPGALAVFRNDERVFTANAAEFESAPRVYALAADGSLYVGVSRQQREWLTLFETFVQ
jgi:cysteine-rich repeat protein